jgi:hypothetical protein
MGNPLDMTPSRSASFRDSTPDLEHNRMDELRRRYADEGYLLLPRPARPCRGRGRSRAGGGFTGRRAGSSIPGSSRPNGIAARRARVSTFGFEAEDHRFERVRAIALAGRLMHFYERFFDAPPRAFDYVWLRLMAPGQATPPHCDIVYMGRGTHDFCSTWIPLTSPPASTDGPLMVLERSHGSNACARATRAWTSTRTELAQGQAAARSPLPRWRLSRHPRKVGSEFGLRWLTSEFACGDVVAFSPFAHARIARQSLAPGSASPSTPRYQRAADPIDERWVGEHPIAHSRAE